ncbi:MAG: short-chain dehydrogenase [Bacteroidetes bacterium]|nr:short-chain dehydrogenase [Bacteroidota bacterium]
MRSALQGKTAIITGASSGIGKATALLMAREKMNLVLAARRAGELNEVRRETEARGSRVLACPADVTDAEQVQALVEKAVSLFGRVDIVVCSAGQLLRRPAVDLTIGDFRHIMEVNFYGSLNLIYAALPGMLERRSGHIIVVSSVDGKKGLPPDTAYVASKCAVNGFMDVLRQELRGTGVHACTILPGRVDTPMVKGIRFPLGSRGIPGDRVARSIVRAIRKRRTEVVVPYIGPKTLIVANSFSPRLGDWLVRLFKLEGVEEGSDMSHNDIGV